MENNQLLLEINKKLLNFIDNEFKVKIVYIESGLKYASSFLFAKSTKTFRALNILCQNGYGEDAAILARSVLENVINLAYMNEDDKQNRAELFIYHSFIDRKNKIKQIENNQYYPQNIEKKFTDKFEEVYKKAVKLQDYECKKIKSERKYNIKKQSWSCLSLANMAEETKLKELYYDQIYWLISNLSHPSDNASMNYIFENKNGGILINDMPSDKWVEQSLILGFDCFYKMVQLVNDIFELNFDNKIRIMEKEYLKITKS